MTADFDRGSVDLAREADFRLGSIQVRPATRQIESGGASETLEPRIMQVLVVLARRRGEVVSREELIEACWEGRIVGDDALNRCTSRIRKIGEASGAFRLETIPRVGYRMHVEESASDPGTPAGTAPKSAQRRWLVPVAAAAAALVVAIAGLTWWINLNSRTVTIAPVTTLAVLPFDALDDDPEIKRMAAVVPRDMADLFTGAGISITAPAQSMAYGGDAKPRAAGELGAELLLDGTVKREGDKARVSVRLYHAKRRITLWSGNLASDTDDSFVDDRLAAMVAQTISWSSPQRLLNSDRPNAVEEARTSLRILEVSYAGRNIEAAEAARKFALDAPDLLFARTVASIETIASLPATALAERKKKYEFARSEAEAAFELNPREGSSYLAKSQSTPTDKWAERIETLRQGINVDPQYSRNENNLSEHLLAVGASGDGLAAVVRARGAEPLSMPRALLVAKAYMANSRIDDMNKELAHFEQVWPGDSRAARLRFFALASSGEFEKAKAQLSVIFPAGFSGPAPNIYEAMLKARRSGKTEDADWAVTPCTRIADDWDTAEACMTAGAMLNRLDAAFAGADVLMPRTHNDPAGEDVWLARRPLGMTGPAQRLFMPWMAPVRADPRVIDVFERIGLLDYWKQSGSWPDFCRTEAQSVCDKMKARAPN